VSRILTAAFVTSAHFIYMHFKSGKKSEVTK